jgi:hypothetical protein
MIKKINVPHYDDISKITTTNRSERPTGQFDDIDVPLCISKA